MKIVVGNSGKLRVLIYICGMWRTECSGAIDSEEGTAGMSVSDVQTMEESWKVYAMRTAPRKKGAIDRILRYGDGIECWTQMIFA